MKTSSLLILAVASFAPLAACAVEATPATERSDQETAAMCSPVYVSVRQDLRMCRFPICGGLYLTQVDEGASPVYVPQVDLSALDQATQTTLHAGGASNWVLSGRFTNVTILGASYKGFKVTTAYLAMPAGNTAVASNLVYYGAKAAPIQCITQPCPQNVATTLNTGVTTRFLNIADDLGVTADDPTLLNGEILDFGAIVLGQLVPNSAFPKAVDLQAQRVFLPLPQPSHACVSLPPHRCETGTAPVYTRDEYRCVYFAGCATPGICPLYVPSCNAGYSLETWAAAPNACTHYACDPSFLGPQH